MHDLESRRDLISQLIEHVRLPLLSQDYLIQRVEEEPLVKHNSRCKDFLIEAMKYHLLRAEQKPLYLTPRTKLRSPTGLPKARSCTSNFSSDLMRIFCAAPQMHHSSVVPLMALPNQWNYCLKELKVQFNLIVIKSKWSLQKVCCHPLTHFSIAGYS